MSDATSDGDATTDRPTDMRVAARRTVAVVTRAWTREGVVGVDGGVVGTRTSRAVGRATGTAGTGRRERETTVGERERYRNRYETSSSSSSSGAASSSTTTPFRTRRRADATSEVEWDGKTYAGSRLEYAGVEARGELRWPIPLHALAEVNPDLKALLEVTRTSDGEEERRIASRLSVVEAEDALEGAGERRRDASAFGVVSTSSAARVGVSGFHSVPGLAQFEQRLHETGWRVDVERRAKAKAVRETLVDEAKKKTPLKMKIDDAPLSKTMLSKVRVESIRDAVRELGLEDLTLGVKKKGDLVAHTLAFYEYMFDAVEVKTTTGVRMSEVSNISADIMREVEATSKTLGASRGRREDATTPRLEHETDPSRMQYVKAFRPEELVELLVRAKGIDVVAINVRDQCTWTDHLIITTARSKQHLRALAGAVLHAVKARTEYVAGGQLQPVIEGKENGGDDDWLAVDCGSCMVHVFSPEGRQRYNLEELWASGAEVVHNAPERLTIETIGSSRDEAA